MRRLLTLPWIIVFLTILTVIVNLLVVSRPIKDLKITKAQADLSIFQFALDRYKLLHGRLPSEGEGFAALGGAFTVHVPRDPWGSPYVYRLTDGGYRVYSRGRDGRDDGGGGDDVTTTAKGYRCVDYGVNCPPTPMGLLVVSVTFLWVVSGVAGLVRAVVVGLSHIPSNRRQE